MSSYMSRYKTKCQVICQVIKPMSRYTSNAILTFAQSMCIENSEIPDTFEVHGKHIKNFFRAKNSLFGEKIIGILEFLISVRLVDTVGKNTTAIKDTIIKFEQ